MDLRRVLRCCLQDKLALDAGGRGGSGKEGKGLSKKEGSKITPKGKSGKQAFLWGGVGRMKYE